MASTTARAASGAKTLRRAAAVVGTALCGLTATTLANAEDWPRFRQGKWQFERTLQIANLRSEERQVLMKLDMTRCVDPSVSMKETFRPASIGNCHSKPPQRLANKYVFPLRCDYMGPVSTTIDVQSDTAYTEVNVLQVGQFARTDTVVARRVAACD